MRILKLLVLLLPFISIQASAHHSYAMFDDSVDVSADGTISTWEFTSPHAKLWVYINDDEGKPQLWALEAPGPQALLRSGWTKNTVQPGDKVKVVYHPLRDGRAGGSLVSLTLADGRTMATGGGAPAPSANAKEGE